MKPTLADLQSALAVVVDLFQSNPNALELPGFHSFPKNSCERAAALFAVALARKYPDEEVVFVKGRNPSNGEMHFWVEAGTFAIDPTAHQFEEFSTPFVHERPSPLELTFERDEVHRHPQQSTDLPRNSHGHWSSTLEALCAALDVQPFNQPDMPRQAGSCPVISNSLGRTKPP